MSLTQKDVDHICALAKLDVPRELRTKILKDLGDILEYVKRLEEIDTAGVEPMGHAVRAEGTPARSDSSEEGLGREEAMRGAPDTMKGHFRVPKVI